MWNPFRKKELIEELAEALKPFANLGWSSKFKITYPKDKMGWKVCTCVYENQIKKAKEVLKKYEEYSTNRQ